MLKDLPIPLLHQVYDESNVEDQINLREQITQALSGNLGNPPDYKETNIIMSIISIISAENLLLSGAHFVSTPALSKTVNVFRRMQKL